MKRHNSVRGYIIGFAAVVILILILLATPANAAYDITTERQDRLHDAAEILRSLGYAEDSEVITRIKNAWWQEQEDLNIIAKTIQHEADPAWCQWEHSVAVGAVVVNRVRSPYFPDSVKEVVAQPGQYLVSYTYGFDDVSELAYLAAKDAMDGNHSVPEKAYWQDTNVQGVYIWRAFEVTTIYGFHSTTFICCGVPGVD